MKVVQNQLGHASHAITANIYSHVSPDLSREAVERVAVIGCSLAAVAQIGSSRYPKKHSAGERT